MASNDIVENTKMEKNMSRGWIAIMIAWVFDALAWVFKFVGGTVGTTLSNGLTIGIFVLIFIACIFFWKAYLTYRRGDRKNEW